MTRQRTAPAGVMDALAEPRAAIPEPGAAHWHVYVVRCADGSLYTGVARDLDARIAAHNGGAGAKYTRGRGPVALVYREAAADRSAALKRERAIKALSTGAKRRLVGA